MNNLVSIIMPTSSRQHTHESLVKALKSLKDTATDFSEVEILLRIDDDDPDRYLRVKDLEHEFGVRVFIGPRGEGYNNMGGFVNDLMTLATGRWSWLFDDDSWVEGNWQGALQAVPCDP
jgi:glycosyltransferase involved in cell wall biosynthesis